MSDIWAVIANIGIELHPDRVNTAAERIATLTSVEEFHSIRSSFGPSASSDLVDSLEIEWQRSPGLSPVAMAAALRGAAATASLMKKHAAVEMVWTGPTTGLVASRHTEQVLLEVVSSAKSKIFLVSFVSYNIQSLINALKDAIDRNVEVQILLESSSDHGGKVDIDSVRTFRESLPLAKVYVWNRDGRPIEYLNGAVHAKCAVADENLAFITSANLTKAAMERNMELGTLVRGGDLPLRLQRHLEALASIGTIVRV